MCVCVCVMHTYTHALHVYGVGTCFHLCLSLCEHMKVRVRYFPSLFFQARSLLNLELAFLAGLLDQQACRYPNPHDAPSVPDFIWVWGSEPRFSELYNKHFTHWDISPAQISSFSSSSNKECLSFIWDFCSYEVIIPLASWPLQIVINLVVLPQSLVNCMH